MKNTMKIFTALLCALFIMPGVVNAKAETPDALKIPGAICIAEIKDKHKLTAKWDTTGHCQLISCMDGWKVENNVCKETEAHQNCLSSGGTWGIKKCTCLYGVATDGKCKAKPEKKANTQQPTQQNNATTTTASTSTNQLGKSYDKDVDALIKAYNTVTKEILTKCVANGKSIEDCKQ